MFVNVIYSEVRKIIEYKVWPSDLNYFFARFHVICLHSSLYNKAHDDCSDVDEANVSQLVSK